MKNKKQIRKLRKVHILPSVLFLLITIFLAIVAYSAFLSYVLMSLAGQRIESSAMKAESLFNQFELNQGNEAEYLSLMQSIGGVDDSVFIYDKDGNIIAGIGEETYYEESVDVHEGDAMSFVECSIFPDKAEDNMLAEDGSFDSDVVDKKAPGLRKASEMELFEEVCVASYWFEGELSGGRRMMVRCEAPLYVADYLKGYISGLVVLGIFSCTLLMFFINVILSLINQKHMSSLLFTNTITGGKNLIYFEHEADRFLNSRKSSYFVVDVTVMKYRSFCNYHGVHAGEELLQKVHNDLTAYMNKKEIAVIADKSSFALLLKYTDKESAESRVRDLVSELTEKYDNEGIVFHGGIFFPEPPDNTKKYRKKDMEKIDPADCYSRAGAARASLSDVNIPDVAIYDEKLLEEQIWEHKVTEKMEAALENNVFHVYIQPKYDPVTEKLSGAEALVRWINDDDGFVSPGKFIPIFEKNGFITRLDDFMLESVAKLQSEWLKEGKEIVPISVNISRAHFADPELSAHICGIIDKYEVPHKYIEIELTESAFFDEKEVLLRTVEELRRLEFEISMDDFGAGYSSLNSLKDLPLDVLKLDADFFRGENSRSRGEIVVAQAITLAKKLNMRIVAEGIENKEQVDFLAEQGCDMIQGYYYAKPMPADEYAERL